MKRFSVYGLTHVFCIVAFFIWLALYHYFAAHRVYSLPIEKFELRVFSKETFEVTLPNGLVNESLNLWIFLKHEIKQPVYVKIIHDSQSLALSEYTVPNHSEDNSSWYYLGRIQALPSKSVKLKFESREPIPESLERVIPQIGLSTVSSEQFLFAIKVRSIWERFAYFILGVFSVLFFIFGYLRHLCRT